MNYEKSLENAAHGNRKAPSEIILLHIEIQTFYLKLGFERYRFTYFVMHGYDAFISGM